VSVANAYSYVQHLAIKYKTHPTGLLDWKRVLSDRLLCRLALQAYTAAHHVLPILLFYAFLDFSCYVYLHSSVCVYFYHSVDDSPWEACFRSANQESL
jgi:hypothetical protein